MFNLCLLVIFSIEVTKDSPFLILILAIAIPLIALLFLSLLCFCLFNNRSKLVRNSKPSRRKKSIFYNYNMF